MSDIKVIGATDVTYPEATISPGTGLTITEAPAGTFTLDAAGGGGITDINSNTGPSVQIAPGSGGITITQINPNQILVNLSPFNLQAGPDPGTLCNGNAWNVISTITVSTTGKYTAVGECIFTGGPSVLGLRISVNGTPVAICKSLSASAVHLIDGADASQVTAIFTAIVGDIVTLEEFDVSGGNTSTANATALQILQVGV